MDQQNFMPQEFGVILDKKKKDEALRRKRKSFTMPDNDDGSTIVTSGGAYYGTYLELDVIAKNESDLISKYRQTSMHPDVDTAVQEIVNDAIITQEEVDPVEIDTSKLEYSDKIKNSITDEFNHIMKLLDMKNRATDIFYRWYVDGRIYYEKIFDENAITGIQELRYIDPRKIKKVKNVVREKDTNGLDIVKKTDIFYLYNEQGINFSVNYNPKNISSGVKISPENIAFAPSGLMDMDSNIVISHLHKAIKPTNQLKMLADSLVIYRLSRAPERRIFYIDVGNLPQKKAEEYMKDLMNRYKNKIVYDSATGEIRDSRKFMTMLEDFWLPRKDGKGTEISTLPGGDHLDQIADIEYFQNKLYQALNVPTSRFNQESQINFGRVAEINREELKFAKFVDRLRRKFSVLFDDLLRTQLIAKRIITPEEWNDIKDKITYVFAQDQYYEESKEGELLRNRLDILNQVNAYIGTYFSKNYVRKKILRMTDEEIKEIDDDNKKDPTLGQEDDGMGQAETGPSAIQAAELSKQVD